MADTLTEADAAKVLSVVPSSVASAPGSSKTGLPAQQMITAGISGAIAWGLLAAAAHFGFDPQPIVDQICAAMGIAPFAIQPALAGVIGLVIATYMPPSQRDIVNHLTDAIVHAAMKDPTTEVSNVQKPVTPAPGDARVIVPPATTKTS